MNPLLKKQLNDNSTLGDNEHYYTLFTKIYNTQFYLQSSSPLRVGLHISNIARYS